MPLKEHHLAPVIYMGFDDGEWVSMSSLHVDSSVEAEEVSQIESFKELEFSGEMILSNKDVLRLRRILFSNNYRRMHGMKPKRYVALRRRLSK